MCLNQGHLEMGMEMDPREWELQWQYFGKTGTAEFHITYAYIHFNTLTSLGYLSKQYH